MLEFVIILVCAAVMSYVLCFGLIAILGRLRVVDKPSKRSNHDGTIPRGGGIGILVAMGVSLLLADYFSLVQDDAVIWNLFPGVAILAVISFLDDIFGAPVWLRLPVQACVVVASTHLLLGDLSISHGELPEWADNALAVLLWLWFINLFNFMDGIDGISAVQGIVIALGVFLAAGLVLPVLPTELGVLSIVISGALVGFLAWNWHPAKLFLGDVGSITLGYILGFQLLELVAIGLWYVALLLPMYYLADATYTLVRRMARREKFWHPHSNHAYQVAVRRGRSHARVVSRILLLNIVLLILAINAIIHPSLMWALLVVGVGLTALLTLRFLHIAPKKKSRKTSML